MAYRDPNMMSWVDLQTFIMKAREDELIRMLEAEKFGKKRTQYLIRIHSRFNVLRARRERKDLTK